MRYGLSHNGGVYDLNARFWKYEISQDDSEHQDSCFGSGIPINLYLPLLLGGGHTHSVMACNGIRWGTMMEFAYFSPDFLRVKGFHLRIWVGKYTARRLRGNFIILIKIEKTCETFTMQILWKLWLYPRHPDIHWLMWTVRTEGPKLTAHQDWMSRDTVKISFDLIE